LGYRKDVCAETKARRLGAALIPRLSKDIHNELPEIKEFSEWNVRYMNCLAKEYGKSVLPQAVAKLTVQALLADIPCGGIPKNIWLNFGPDLPLSAPNRNMPES